jgi:hypothetical protein
MLPEEIPSLLPIFVETNLTKGVYQPHGGNNFGADLQREQITLKNV